MQRRHLPPHRLLRIRTESVTEIPLCLCPLSTTSRLLRITTESVTDIPLCLCALYRRFSSRSMRTRRTPPRLQPGAVFKIRTEDELSRNVGESQPMLRFLSIIAPPPPTARRSSPPACIPTPAVPTRARSARTDISIRFPQGVSSWLASPPCSKNQNTNAHVSMVWRCHPPHRHNAHEARRPPCA
jgi:hypothetical protein|eukprot:COSAG01_NODE_3824_length_5658_cov_8.480482_5_plen_185_part_00